MRRRRFFTLLGRTGLLALAGGCSFAKMTRPAVEPPTGDVTPTRIDYADTDAFDALFETALTNQDPAVLVQTRHAQPDWGDRLNAWITAWNMGGRPADGAKVRMQAPFVPKVVVDGDSIREFRLLVEGLMAGLDGTAARGVAWLAEEKTRSRRVKLLKPYNLRFHMDEDGNIQLVFFHGRYADFYREFVRALAGDDLAGDWERGFACSMCVARKPVGTKERPPGRLTSTAEGGQ